MRQYRQYLATGVVAFCIAIIFASCAATKNVPYFKDIPDSTKEKMIVDAPYTDPVIIPDDILSVTIVTIDPNTSAPVNQAAAVPVASSNMGTPELVPGLLVDKNGDITLPIIGAVKVAGLTSYQAKALIKSRASKYYKDPDVQLRFANFKITVLGEVERPASYVVPNEKINIFDALGMAGDMTIYAQKENVLLMRDTLNDKKLIRLNLNNKNIVGSPYFYIQANDVIYVEPNKYKIASTDAYRNRYFAIAAAVLSVMIVAISKLL